MTDPDSSAQPAAGAGPRSMIIRAACIMLMVIGAGSVAITFPTLIDPPSTRCQLSRTWIEDANKDKKTYKHVDTGGVKPSKLPCAQAIKLAGQIRLDEKGDRTQSVPSEKTLRIQSLLTIIMALGQAISGSILLRTFDRRVRAAAIGFSAFGILLRILGVLSLGVFFLALYAFAFSPASREIWPRKTQSDDPAGG